MMQRKGKAETVEVDMGELTVGDHVEFEVGDWNGAGFSYNANGGGPSPAYVVEVKENEAVFVFTHDRLEWVTEGDTSLEFTVRTDGFMEDVDMRADNPRVKSYENVETRGGYHKVVHGLEKTRDE